MLIMLVGPRRMAPLLLVALIETLRKLNGNDYIFASKTHGVKQTVEY